MPPPLYKAVNKVLGQLGGRWKTNKGHFFPGDPRDALDEALLTGQIMRRTALGFYFTSREMANLAVTWADLRDDPDSLHLEPSAGEGHIAEVMRFAAPQAVLRVMEIDQYRRSILERRGFTVHYHQAESDFLKFPRLESFRRFDRIVMNPPFNRQEYLRHILHALRAHLARAGRLVSIVPVTVDDLDTQLAEEFRRELKRYDHTWYPNDPDAFKESGTNIPTKTLVLAA
jgi:predicted RNA methylase